MHETLPYMKSYNKRFHVFMVRFFRFSDFDETFWSHTRSIQAFLRGRKRPHVISLQISFNWPWEFCRSLRLSDWFWALFNWFFNQIREISDVSWLALTPEPWIERTCRHFITWESFFEKLWKFLSENQRTQGKIICHMKGCYQDHFMTDFTTEYNHMGRA